MADRVETIGIYSAYGFAKEAGYTGTKAEFEQGLKNSAEYADNAASSANAATNAKNAAVTAKTDAQAAQSAAETAQGLAEDAQAAAEGAQSAAEAAAASLDASTIARIDGYYSDLAAGTADQLMASQKVHNSDPYIFRTSGGTSDIGNREELEIVGGSIVWNQGVSFNADKIPSARNGITFTKDGDACIISGTVESNYPMTASGWFSLSENDFLTDYRLNHALLIITKHISGTVTDNNNAVTLNGFANEAFGGGLSIGNNRIFKMGGVIGAQHRLAISSPVGTVFDNYKFTMMCFDLTAMFGSEIADHIYELEHATAGAGVAWFRKYFPNDYYDYNPGELMHVSDLQSHDTVGFNLFNKNAESHIEASYRIFDINPIAETNLVNIELKVKDANAPLPSDCAIGFVKKEPINTSLLQNEFRWVYNDGTAKNRTYNLSGGVGSYGANLLPRLIIYPSDEATLNAVLNHFDICIHLVWSGTRDGEYEPYVKHSYPLDPSLTLRGVPKLTADGDLTYDGDIYKPDGTVERRYGIVDLGTLSWTRDAVDDIYAFFSPSLVNTIKRGRSLLMCDNYVTWYGKRTDLYDKSICKGNLSDSYSIYIRDDSYTDATSFKDAMSGVYLVYELAEPTTEEAEPYTSHQIVDEWGTEEFVTTSIVPVGHNTSYPANLRDKLQHLPDLPDNDGYYMTQVTGTQMSLIRFMIPQAPAEDGEYILKATVSNGTPTYTWEAVVEAEGGEG